MTRDALHEIRRAIESGAKSIAPEDSHPVLVRETVQVDGSRKLALRVYCTDKDESVDFDACRVCARCLDIEADLHGAAWVRCRTTRPPPEVAAEVTSVGSVLRSGALCVRDDVRVASVASILIEREMAELYVVDAEGLFLGAVRDLDLLKMNAESRLNAVAATLMSSAVRLGEGVGLHDALVALASAHSRRAAIVTVSGVLVAALDDIALLERWNRLRRKPP